METPTALVSHKASTPTVSDVDMVMKELETLQQRVDSIEVMVSPAPPLPPPLIVGYMSPAPRRTPKSAKKPPKSPKSSSKIPIGKKPRRSKRSKDKRKKAVPTTKSTADIVAAATPLTRTPKSTFSRKPKTSSRKSSPIPWAKTPNKSLPTRFSSPNPTEANGFISNDSTEIFKPVVTTAAPAISTDDRRRPLLLAKKLYGHFVNLQTQYVDLKTTLDRQANALNKHHFKIKKLSNSNLLLKEENALFQARMRVAQSISEKKSLKAQSSVNHFLNSFNKKLLGSCLNHWRSYVQIVRTQKQKMARFLMHWKYRHVGAVFKCWVYEHIEAKAKKNKLATFQKRWAQHILLRGFNKFKSATKSVSERQQNLHHLVVKICKIWSYYEAYVAFSSWSSKTEHMRNVEVTTRRILRHWTTQREQRMLLTWKRFAEKRRFLRRCMTRCMHFRRHKKLRPAFKKWQDFIAFSIDEEWIKEQDELKDIIVERDQTIANLERFRDMVYSKERDKALSVLNRILHSQLFAAWKVWKEEADEMTRLENVKNRVMAKWRLRPCAKAIFKWTNWVSKRQRVRKIVQRAFSDRSHKKKVAALNTWKMFMSLTDHHMLRNLLTQKEGLLADTEAKLAEKDIEVKGLANFKEKILLANQDRAISVLSRLMKISLHHSIQIWKEHADEDRRQEGLMNRFLKKWKLMPALSCIHTWKDYVRTRVHLRHIMMRAFSDGHYRMMDAAMRTWKHFVYSFDTCKLQETIDSLGATTMAQSKVLEVKEAEIESLRRHLDNLYGEKKGTAVKALSRIINAQKAAAFETWHDMAKELIRNEAIIKKFASRIKNAGAVRCLRSWSEFAKGRVHLRSFINKNIFNKSAKMLNIAWRTWVHNTEKVSEERMVAQNEHLQALLKEAEERLASLEDENHKSEEMLLILQRQKTEQSARSMRRFVNMWQNKCLTTTLTSWKAYVLERQSQKRVMRKFLTRMVQAKLLAPFKCWTEFVVFDRRCEALLDKFGKKWMYRTVCKVLESWKEFVVVSRQQREDDNAWEWKVASVLAKMTNSRLYRIFNGWRENTTEMRRNRDIVKKFVKRMKLDGVRRSIVTWRQLVATRKFLRRICNRMIGGHESKMLAMGFSSWKRFIQSLGQDEMDRMISLNEELSTRLKAQVEQIEDLESHIRGIFGQQTEKAVKVLHKMLHSQLNAGFNAWRANIEEMKHHEEILRKFANRIRLSSANKAFHSLRENASERRFLRRFVKKMTGGKRDKFLMAGLRTWKEATAYLRENAVDDQIRALENEIDEMRDVLEMYEARYATEIRAKKDKAKRVILKLLNGKIMVAFEIWRDALFQEKRNEEIRLKFAKRMRFRGAIKAIQCWKVMVHERKFLKRLLNRLFGGKEIAQKSAAFRTWCDSVRGYKEGEEHAVIEKLETVCNEQCNTIDYLKEDLEFFKNQIESLQSEKMVATQKAMKNFIQLWQNKGLIKVFTAWKGLVSGMVQRKFLMQRVILKWQNKLVVKIFRSWSTYVKGKAKKIRRDKEVEEGEWQDFLRDARKVSTPKGRGGGGGGRTFFGSDEENSYGGANDDFDPGDRDEKSVRNRTPTMEDIGALEYLSPKTIRNMNTAELKDELANRGLPTPGSKPALIARLTACQDFLSPAANITSRRSSYWETKSDQVGDLIKDKARSMLR